MNCPCLKKRRTLPPTIDIYVRRPVVRFDITHTIWQLNSIMSGFSRDTKNKVDERVTVLTYR